MREIVFAVRALPLGRWLAATAEGLVLQADSLQELHHEAREQLIERYGVPHATLRIRLCPTKERGVAERPLAIPYERMMWMADGLADRTARFQAEASPSR